MKVIIYEETGVSGISYLTFGNMDIKDKDVLKLLVLDIQNLKLVLIVYRVTFADQTTYDAKVVGFDQDKDVAVLRVNAPKDKLRPIPIGVSADLLVGQKVYAIGNPVSACLYS